MSASLLMDSLWFQLILLVSENTHSHHHCGEGTGGGSSSCGARYWFQDINMTPNWCCNVLTGLQTGSPVPEACYYDLYCYLKAVVAEWSERLAALIQVEDDWLLASWLHYAFACFTLVPVLLTVKQVNHSPINRKWKTDSFLHRWGL